MTSTTLVVFQLLNLKKGHRVKVSLYLLIKKKIHRSRHFTYLNYLFISVCVRMQTLLCAQGSIIIIIIYYNYLNQKNILFLKNSSNMKFKQYNKL